jgi:glutamate/tyrosine decarboxylase-like PLP-dependent enzyme
MVVGRTPAMRFRDMLTCAAFGIFARALGPEPEFSKLRRRVEDMERYVDSITVDGHKLLNVVSTATNV